MEGYTPYRIIKGSEQALVLLTCEHAGQTLPTNRSLPNGDQWLEGTHWAYDIGAANFTYELALVLNSPAILGNFSRLLIDLNRDQNSETLFLKFAEGRQIALNAAMDEEECQFRLKNFYNPYHKTIDHFIGQSTIQWVFGVHTFTPVYEGVQRKIQVGVLFRDEEKLATKLATCLSQAGIKVALNEPYSGKSGMYSVCLHANAHKKRALEIEIRQDLAIKVDFRNFLIQKVLKPFLQKLVLFK